MGMLVNRKVVLEVVVWCILFVVLDYSFIVIVLGLGIVISDRMLFIYLGCYVSCALMFEVLVLFVMVMKSLLFAFV